MDSTAETYFLACRNGTNAYLAEVGSPSLNTPTMIGFIYDGTESTPADRVTGYQNTIRYDGSMLGPDLPSSLSAPTVPVTFGGSSNESSIYIATIWLRTLSEKQMKEVQRDPYQILVPA